MSDISSLVIATVPNTKTVEVENKIPDVSGLVKKTDFNPKISDIERKYFTTSDYNKFASKIIAAKIKQAILATNSDLNILFFSW